MVYHCIVLAFDRFKRVELSLGDQLPIGNWPKVVKHMQAISSAGQRSECTWGCATYTHNFLHFIHTYIQISIACT